MILTIETTLRNVAHMLRDRIAPAVDDKFAGETARLAGMLLDLSAGWVEDAPAIRVAENAQIVQILGDAAPAVADRELVARIAEAIARPNPALKISELDLENNRLRALLAELHEHVDATDSGVAQDLSQRIWRALAGFEAARAPR